VEELNRQPDDDHVLERLLRLIVQMPPNRRVALFNQLEDPMFRDDPDRVRGETRKKYFRTVYFDFENFTYTGAIADISVTGMFIETEEPFRIGQIIMVNIPETRNDGYLRLAAEIMRTDPEGIGVRFLLKAKKSFPAE
jgi:hypothetical protein